MYAIKTFRPQTFCLSPDMEGGRGETITALAHPSSLFIGSTHGVYVMPGQKISGLQELKSCQEVDPSSIATHCVSVR